MTQADRRRQMDTRVERSLSVLATEKVNPATAEIDRMSPLEIVQVINNEDAKVALAVRQVLPSIARAIEEIASRLRRGGRLVYAGAGTSGPPRAFDSPGGPPALNRSPGKATTCPVCGPQALGPAHQTLGGR